jgi:ribosomal protection tetracycline resistance protein
MNTLNLGIVAHVDAGKTTLTERLLFAAGVIDEIGRVDDGSTQTDTLTLERQRGITIKSAVVSFVIDDVTVNLIDTPGHPDFIAEVERVLNVLDGAVLVVSAVEGVQSQTGLLMRTLQRLNIPTLIFVNKIDRVGAQYERSLRSIAERLTPAIIPMGSARGLGTRSPGFASYNAADADFTSRLVDLLADHDEAFLAAYVDDEATVSYRRLRGELAAQTGKGLVHPVFFGSAITGAGVDELISGITELLPAAGGDVDGPVSGVVFKVERAPAGEKIAYVRMFSGTVRVRDLLRFDRDEEGKVTGVCVFERGSSVQRASVAAGRIGRLWGLGEVRIGDAIGEPRTTPERHHFAPPTLETVVAPRRPADKGALHAALTQLAEQDPLINLRQDDLRQELHVSLYGEVQKEVIGATLANDYDLEVEFRETTPICIERPIGVGAAVELLPKARSPTTPFLAAIRLRIEPAVLGSGVRFGLDVKVGSIPTHVYKTVEAFHEAMERTVLETLRQGIYGWEVTDCSVTMIDCDYHAPPRRWPGTTAYDFRLLTPLVLMGALKQAGTVVCEPIHRYHLEIPSDTFGATVSAMTRLRAFPQTQEIRGSSYYMLKGEVPAARVHELQQQLPALTRGEGLVECEFDSYQPVRSKAPTRPRTDYNPINRKEYLLHLMRRV